MRHRGPFIVTAGVLLAASAVAFAAAGGFDTGFGVGGIVREPAAGGSASAWTTAVQSDGRVLVGGANEVVAGHYDFRVRRYLADGADDTTFGTGGVVSLFNFTGTGGAAPKCFDLAVDTGGRIVCVGTGAISATVPKATVVRLLADGSPDAAFGSGGAVHLENVLSAAGGTGARTARAIAFTSVALQSDGKIVAAGRALLEGGKKSSPTYQYAILLVRLLENGSLDTSFGTQGIVVHDRTTKDDLVQLDAVGVQSDGKIVVGVTRAGLTLAESATGIGWVITRYLATGAVDTAFGSVLGTNRQLIGLTVDANDRIVASGYVLYAANTLDVVVARYLSGGTPDSTFGSAGACVFGANTKDQAASSPVVMADGRVVLAVLLYPTTIGVPHAARLTADGALDASFGSGGISDALAVGDRGNDVRGVALAPDGDVVLSGRAIFANGSGNTFEWLIARFDGN